MHCSAFSITVRCHEDRCIKDKCMFWIPTHGSIITCTENSFYSAYKQKKSSGGICAKRKYISYVFGKPIPCSWHRIPHPLRSLAWSQLSLRPLYFPHPPHLLPSNSAFILHKDDINKPDSSVGHKHNYTSLIQETDVFLYFFYYPSSFYIYTSRWAFLLKSVKDENLFSRIYP